MPERRIEWSEWDSVDENLSHQLLKTLLQRLNLEVWEVTDQMQLNLELRPAQSPA